MTSRRIWWIGMGAFAAVAVTTAATPGWRLRRERVAAQAEGLLLEAPPAEGDPRLARLVDDWTPLRNALAEPTTSMSVVRVSEGREKPGDRPRALRWRGLDERALAPWRAQSARSRLGLSPAAFRFEPAGSDEIQTVRTAGRALALAAVLGRRPGENLRAAARLSALLRSEPGFAAALAGTDLGKDCLRAAAMLGLRREVGQALAPPADFRRVLRLGLPQALSNEDHKAPSHGFWERVKDANPFAPDGRLEAVVGWRRLWRELPQDPADFEGASRAVEARLPQVLESTRLLRSQGAVQRTQEAAYSARTQAYGLIRIGRFEAERREAAGR